MPYMFGLYKCLEDWLAHECELKENGFNDKEIIEDLESYISHVDYDIERLTKEKERLNKHLNVLKEEN